MSSPAAAASAAVMADDVARIYDIVGKLQTASADATHMAAESATYEELLNAVKGSDAVKQLAADYIPQFLHFFPAMSEKGINAQLDLIEDDKSMIRIHAIRGLEHMCKNNPATVGRIADVLAQLLSATEPLELTVVKATFGALFHIDAKAAFLALMTQAASGADVPLRKAVIEFLVAQLKQQSAAIKKDASAAASVGAGLKGMLGSAQNALLGRDELKFLIQQVILLSEHGNAPAKIRADEGLKAELANIASVQAGLSAAGGVDVRNEAALSHFLAVQGVVNVLASQYGVDASPFVDVLLGSCLPNLDQLPSPQMRTQIMRAIVTAAAKLTPKQAQQHFAAFWTVFQRVLPNGEIKAKPAAPAAGGEAAPAAAADGAASSAEPAAAESDASASPAAAAAAAASPALDFATAENVLALCHLLAPLAPSELKTHCGIFEPTGQPGESLSAPNPKRDSFHNRIDYAVQCNGEYKSSLRAVERALQGELRASSKKLSALRAKAEGKGAKESSPLATGQPVGPEKVSLAPAAPPAPEPTEDELKAEMKAAREKLASAQAAIRLSSAISSLAKPLQSRPLPKFLPFDQLNLSWKSRKPAAGAASDAKGKQEAGKPRGEKRKAGESAKQAASGKKQKQQTAAAPAKQAGQKRKSGGGSQQSSQQSSQKKKQKQSASNKGGQQQQQAAASEGGSGRRRRRGGRR